jgi:type II secretory pathway pseudopilin PulG
MRALKSESGFSLAELMVATGLLLVVSSIVTSALMQMTQSQQTIWNRTEMHSGIRGATELLQQEVGQAGRISLPGKITLDPSSDGVTAAEIVTAILGADTSCNAAAPLTGATQVALTTDSATETATSGIFADPAGPAYMLLTTMDGDSQETVKVGSVDSGSLITVCFSKPHAPGTVLLPMGSFATGIIPDSGIINASDGDSLKMYGDINGDGKMVYVEYTCDTANHKLYRQVFYFGDAKVAPTDNDILLGNIRDNPGGTPCFTYQTTQNQTPPCCTVQGTAFNFVLDVAITLTVETEEIDPITRQKQTETKALLNVSPRNVFNAWMLASIGYTDRIQSTPTTVTALLAPAS